MPILDSANTSPSTSSYVATRVSLQTEVNKQQETPGTSPDLSEDAELEFEWGPFLDHPPTPFPSLTGLRSRTNVGKLNSATVDSRLTFHDLHSTTKSIGVSPLSIIQAAWAFILSTYTAAQDDVVFTTVTDLPVNRDIDGLSGNTPYSFSTQVCLDTSKAGDTKTIGTILKQLTESNALAISQKRKDEIASIRHEGSIENGTVVALYRTSSREESPDVLDIRHKLFMSEHTTVFVQVSSGTSGLLRLSACYKDLSLNEASALVMLQQLDDILSFILANPGTPIASIFTAVRPSLLSISNQHPSESDNANRQLHSQFEATARDSPHRVALEFRRAITSTESKNDTTWTYAELNERAEAFATYFLNAFGPLTDEVVPICMDRCPELYVTILGILKSGAAWCPIDASFPSRRRHDLIARAGARILVVADRESTEKDQGVPQGVITVDIKNSENQKSDQNGPRDVKIGSLAYLIWTSGTTGDPKGVPIHHEAASTSMRALQRSIPIDVTGGIVRCLQFSHFTFDVFVQDLFYTWGVGGTIISSTREIMLGSFADLANATNATHAHLTPAFTASVPRQRCRTLEVITMIGEKLPQAVADDWSQNIRAFNTYGPAETTVVSTFRQFGAAGDELQSENVGFPLPSVSAFVMGGEHPLMRHGIGELALGGPQLSKGYWNDPERSAGRFVWNEQLSTHLYMTGDIVRQLYDGSFEFVGRVDDLIKIQGIRIELSEISFSLRSCHPLVEQVETQYFDRQDRPSKIIVAFLAAPSLEDTKNSTGRLIANEKAVPIAKSALIEAQKALAEYMIPRVFLVVNHIPRTSSNKTDKATLKAIYSSSDLGIWERALSAKDIDSTGDSTWTQRESTIIALIAKLSGTFEGSMSRLSDLRSIGVDSITATRLAPMLIAKGFDVSVATVLQCQTLGDVLKIPEKSSPAQMTDQYDLGKFHNEWYSKVRKKVASNHFYLAPALPLQESLLSESMQNANAYWSNTFLSLDTRVDIDRLHDAWSQVVSRTEALRTGFIPSAAISEDCDDTSISNSTFLQLIYSGTTINWTDIKVPGGNLKDVSTQQAHRIADKHQKDSFRDPPVAISVFEQPDGITMMISIHHGIRDELSLHFILEDLHWSYQNIDEFTKKRHQLREALNVMLPTRAQITQDETFWSKALTDFAVNDDANTWPDLTGKNARSEDPAIGFMTHVQPLTTSYKDLQAAGLSFGASSVASILRVAWGSIMLMYLETDKVVFAETWSDRVDDSRLTDVVGPLVAVLPVPFRALGSVREALQSQSDFQRKSRSHRSIHPRVIRKLIGRPENQPLYPAMFNFLPGTTDDSQTSTSSMWKKLDNLISLNVEHPIALNVAPAADGALELELTATKDIMSTTQLAMLARQFDALVTAMLEFPDQPLTQLSSRLPMDMISMTSVPFSEEVKTAWRQQPTEWVDHFAAIQPQWPAVQVYSNISSDQCDSETWTFADLQSAYKRVAAFLKHNGYDRRMIAVCLDRRIEVYAVILGILASGNTYLPIDEDLPEERKSFLLQDSAAAMLFTIKSLASTFQTASFEGRVVHVDDNTYKEQMLNGHSNDIELHPQPSDNAYLLYTSGSTGVPKGVLVGRGNLCSFIEGLSEYICPRIPGMKDLPGKGRYLGLASRAFDVHIAEMFLAWRQGMAAVTAPRTLLLDNLELALQCLKITHASFVPSLIDQAGLDPVNLPNLHYLGVGGEKMSKRVVDTWAASTNAALINAYGPTELSIGCTAAEVTPNCNLRNVGPPYGNSVAHVLVPGTSEYTLRGVAGELCVTGALVANGYHNRPDAKGFVDDFNGQRMYRTGDIVRLTPDDTVEYLRREDDQTKVRGQRLELGEISEAIRSLAMATLGLGKVDVATMVAQHPKLSRPQLVSFIVAMQHKNDGTEKTEILGSTESHTAAADVQNHCQKVLPAYMVPDIVIPLTELPLAPSSGKADMKRLKTLFANMALGDIVHRSSSAKAGSSKRELSQAEKVVRKQVASILAVDEANVLSNTDIFRLGLDSLNAINIAVKMQKLGYECTVSSILRNPVLENLARLPRNDKNADAQEQKLEQTRSRLADLESRFQKVHPLGISDVAIHTVRPCLPLQETLVAASLTNKSGALYVNNVILELSPEVDLARLRDAWASVVADHDILRTCFQEVENEIVQIVLECDESISASWKEVCTSDADAVLKNLQANPSTDIVTDIGEKAPLRLTLLRSSDRASSSLLIQIHHALYDAESFAMILDDLKARYYLAEPSAHVPFDAMLEHVYGQDQEASKDFWRHYLSQYKPSSVLDGAESASTDMSDQAFLTVNRTLASPLDELEDFASSTSGTLTSTIQAVFGIILAQILDTSDVVFGAVLSGRTVPLENPESIVAPCITTIPQRVNLETSSSTVVDIVKLAQLGFAESLEYQHTALRHIHRWVEAEKALFDCLVTYVRKRKPKPESQPQLWTEQESSMTHDFPLSVEFEADHENNRMRAHCAFSPAFGDNERATSLLESVDLLLGALVREENVTTGDLGITHGGAIDAKARPQVWDESKWSRVELKMQTLVAETGGISPENIAKGASFFTLGIDSITAIRFAQRLRKSGIECSSADVMRHACIGALAQYVDALSSDINGVNNSRQLPEADFSNVISQVPRLSVTDTVKDVYRCTPLQSSMLTQTLGSDGKLYANHHAFCLSDNVNLLELKQAWERLVAETEILRTTLHFFQATGTWLAAVHEEAADTCAELDATDLMSDSLAEIMTNFIFCDDAAFERPPWRMTILKNATERIIVISMHHSLYDGVSINILFEDLVKLYKGIDLPPRPPFSEAARAISKSTDDAEDFWLHKLDDFENNESLQPLDSEDTNFLQYESRFQMDVQDIIRGCKAIGVTVQTAALLAYAKSLACLFKRRDVVFGHVVGGRSLAIPGADDIVGPLFNTVPSRVSMDKTYVTNKSMAIEIQEFSGESQSHQHASLSRIQRAWRKKTGDPNAQFFDALFVFQNNVNTESSADSLWTTIDIDTAGAPTEYSLNVEFEQQKDMILLRVGSRKTLMDIGQLLDWISSFEQIFQDILDHPSKSVLAFPASLQSLPLNVKMDKSESPPQDAIESGPDLNFIRAALSKVSQISSDDISTDVSIFSLGLDSIAAIQVAAACRKQGYTISVADVLQGRSVGGICRRLRERNQDNRASPLSDYETPLISTASKSKALIHAKVDDEDVEHVLPCLAGQTYHLAGWLRSGRTMGEAVFIYQCSEPLDVDSVRSAWRRLRDRHSILRSQFVAVSPGEAMQIVLKPSPINNDSFNYTRYQGALEDSIIDQIKREAQQPFDLFTPPSKLHLIQSEQRSHIILKLHHATYDAWTIQTMIDDLAELYRGSTLPSALHFEPFVRHIFKSLHTKSEKTYWRKSLVSCQQTLLESLSTHSPAPASPTVKAPPIFVTLKSAIPDLHTLETGCRKSSTSLPTLILLAFARVLAHHISVPHPTFGLYQTGRSASYEGIEKLCAPCLNVTPVCVPRALEISASENAQLLQADLANRVAFEQSYLGEVLELVGNGEKPMFNTYVNILAVDTTQKDFQPTESSLSSLFTPYQLPGDNPMEVFAEAASSRIEDATKTAVDSLDTSYLAKDNFYLDVVRKVGEDCIDFAIRCDRELMDEGVVRAFAGNIVREVERVVEEVGRDSKG